ncbi:MAG: M20/M25/M40 family metallo-hydrolase [Polyangiaceae bacterium]
MSAAALVVGVWSLTAGCARTTSMAIGTSHRSGATNDPEAALPARTRALQDRGLASRRAAETVRSLTDEVGPRLSGSKNYLRAVSWAERVMAEEGLTNVRREALREPVWVRGVETATLSAPEPHALAVTALGNSVATAATGIRAGLVEASSLDALDAAGRTKVAGKIVFLNCPMEKQRDGSGYGKAVGCRSQGPGRAANLGAVAVVIRSVGTDTNRLPHTGATRRQKDTVPAGALSVPDADHLHRVLAAHPDAELELTLTPKTLEDTESFNVVGEVVGESKPEEIVLLAAHLDSWDLGTGALDDGAGLAIILEAARLVKESGTRPKRTIRVVFYANEEVGLAGAIAYAKDHAAELPNHVAAMEADSGTAKVIGVRVLGAPDAAGRATSLFSELSHLGIVISGGDAEGGADTSTLRAAGVPVVDLRQDFSTYFDFHHTANDTFDKIDAEALAQAATAFAVTARTLADADFDLGRIPEAKRDRKH